MVVSESADSSFWHKCTMKADRGAEVFDMLPLRGVGPVVPVPESAVDQFAGLSCARPQSGFCGESVCSADAAEQLSWSVATFRGELGADAFPPASAFRRRMFALSHSSCSSRSPFYENRARPLYRDHSLFTCLLFPPAFPPCVVESHLSPTPRRQHHPLYWRWHTVTSILLVLHPFDDRRSLSLLH